MWRVAGLAIVLTCGAAAAAHAAEPFPYPTLSPLSIAPSSGGGDDAIGALLSKAPATDAAPVDWRSSEFRFTPKAALRISVGDPLGYSGAHRLQPSGYGGAQSYELSLVRDWPGAVSFNTAGYGLDLTPHAGLGVTSYGGLAEAGATLQIGQRVSDAVKAKLNAMGVRDGASFGGKGRWYLFAAASGRSVGLNMLRNEAGWARAGWTTDQASTLVGDAQVGVGWRKGDVQTSLGFVHREIKGMHNLYGQDPPKADSLVAFSLSVRPGR